jgi:aminoglycoside phosphotransferase (APT) family kinase protein
VAELADWLRRHRIPDGFPTLLHCDFKLDNVVWDPETLRPRAVLDWDMATRGDPLLDLATLLSYWAEADDPEAMRNLGQMPTAQEGFPRRRAVVAAYAALTGRDVSDFLFHRVLAMFKLGIAFLQLYARYRAGTTQDARFAGFESLAYGILDFTQVIAHGRAF